MTLVFSEEVIDMCVTWVARYARTKWPEVPFSQTLKATRSEFRGFFTQLWALQELKQNHLDSLGGPDSVLRICENNWDVHGGVWRMFRLSHAGNYQELLDDLLKTGLIGEAYYVSLAKAGALEPEVIHGYQAAIERFDEWGFEHE